MSNEIVAWEIPVWLPKKTFALQYNPNCPSPFLVRMVGKGKGCLDLKPYISITVRGEPKEELTQDALGFGKTLTEAAEKARKEAEQP